MISYLPPALAGVALAPLVPAGFRLGYVAIVAIALASVALLGIALRPVLR